MMDYYVVNKFAFWEYGSFALKGMLHAFASIVTRGFRGSY